MEALVNEIVSRIQENLLQSSSKNDDIKAIIRSEVLSLIHSGEISESAEMVSRLERNIQEHLLGAPSLRTQRRDHYNAAISSEWAQLNKYAALIQNQQERAKALETQQRKQLAQKELKEQVASLLAHQKRERKAKAAELQRINEDVRVWRHAEVAARDARRAAAHRLKAERQTQLDDLHRRQEIAYLLQKASDARFLEAIRNDAKKAEEAEKASRARARIELQSLFENNRSAEAAREQACMKERELEQKYMQQYTEMLAQQEAQRQAQLHKVRAIQAAQAADAATRPSFKRWVDPELIERQAAAAEAQLAVKEAEKAATASAATKACNAEISAQLQERQRAQQLARQAKVDELNAVTAALIANQAEEAQCAQHLAMSNRRFKEGLDSQVSQHRRDAKISPKESMNEEEKKLNARILREMKKNVVLLDARSQPFKV